jgi:quinoprotein glucose dehydrogenase
MQTRFESTPIMWGGVLYVTSPRNRVLALDPATGATRWTFDPLVNVSRPYAEGLTSRGLSGWTDTASLQHIPCKQRLFLATVDSRLFAIDALRGTLCGEFGNNGVIRLDSHVGLADHEVSPSQYTVTSPPATIGDVVIVGSAVGNNVGSHASSGVVRAFDARTGDLRWSFDPIPRSDDHPARLGWTSKSSQLTGGANVWSIISTDPERDLVFLPTGSAAPDYYGGMRPGRNDFANSVVAVRGSTGEVVWSYQIVHHDLWDYDVAAQPLLVTLRRGFREVPAVVVGTKTGMLFVIDRETGIPLLPVEERQVPRSHVPGEKAWSTQPFPSTLPLLHGTLLTSDSAFGITESDRDFCAATIASLSNQGIFTPPSLQGTLMWPGFWGGINWDGMAWDPHRQLILVTVKRLATVVRLHSRDGLDSKAPDPRSTSQYVPQYGAPYAATRGPLVAPSGVPCTPPPWGSLVAVDLSNESIRWRRPLGTVPWLAHLPRSTEWGSLVFGGPLVTASGLVFIAASQDDRFRAFDIETGNLLWEHALPAGGQASPMTYRYAGRQYVVIAAGCRAGIGSPGDWIVAFALPE